uniref:Uncharacterized protein n=1 Tax=Klebsiella pneumoniae TaxID=573 RepID=A0A2P1BNM5_KLEPN|nr:hypothetical protein [Klebsiella pneumoniae]
MEALQEAGLDSVAVEAAKLKRRCGDPCRAFSVRHPLGTGLDAATGYEKSGSTTTPDTDADNEDNTACAA